MKAAWTTLLVLSLAPVPAKACELGKDLSRPVAGAVATLFGPKRHPILDVDKFHTGIDFDGRRGDPVRAASAGRVARSGLVGAYGKLVVIEHADGIETWYAHLSQIDVRAGDCVEAGRVIGLIGATGLASSEHLHFEVHDHGHPTDPMLKPGLN